MKFRAYKTRLVQCIALVRGLTLETVYLARFVDSPMVVIQSGLTTRAQLREVVLQRLEVPAVGPALNGVSIEKANPSFRRSVRAVEQGTSSAESFARAPFAAKSGLPRTVITKPHRSHSL